MTKVAACFVLLVAAAATEGPCDIFFAGETPCVAAHSTVRALYSTYDGFLYQVVRVADNTTKDIPVLEKGGFANSTVQDEFCRGSDCIIRRIYDQSPYQNHLDIAPPGCGWNNHSDTGCDANAEKLIVGGHSVYAAHFKGGDGYRNDNTSGVAKGDEPETLYMVTSGTHYNHLCCFDYGNAAPDNCDDGSGTMEAIYFGSGKGGPKHGGAGAGPWIMADLENGLWGADVVQSNEPPINHDFITAMVKGDVGLKEKGGEIPGHWAIKGGNAQSGKLAVYFDGKRPSGWSPMKKKGAVILGIGGDNGSGSAGTFYEGCMTKGYSSEATDNAVQANIVAAGYQRLVSQNREILV